MEPYHSAVGKKVGGFAHGQNREAMQAPQDCRLAPAFVTAQEEYVAALDFLRLPEHADMQCSRPNGLSLKSVLELLAAWLVVEDAQVYEWVFSAKYASGPFYELSEVEEKRGLDLILLICALGEERP